MSPITLFVWTPHKSPNYPKRVELWHSYFGYVMRLMGVWRVRRWNRMVGDYDVIQISSPNTVNAISSDIYRHFEYVFHQSDTDCIYHSSLLKVLTHTPFIPLWLILRTWLNHLHDSLDWVIFLFLKLVHYAYGHRLCIIFKFRFL